jgi:hypothetical protein
VIRDRLFSFLALEADWDGYGAVVIERSAVEGMCELLDSLECSSDCFVSPCPDGSVDAEWYSSPRCCISIEVSPDKSIG